MQTYNKILVRKFPKVKEKLREGIISLFFRFLLYLILGTILFNLLKFIINNWQG